MAMSKGCIIGLIILAAIVLLILVGIIVIWMNKDKIVGYVFEVAEKEIVANLPDGYTPEMVHQLIVDLQAGIKSGQVSDTQVQELAGAFQTALNNDKKIDKDEGKRLLNMIEQALGRQPAPIEEAPPDTVPVPDTMMQVAPDSV